MAPGHRDAVPDGAERQVHALRYLVVAVSRQVHGEGCAVCFLEAAYSLGDILCGETAFRNGVAGVVRQAHVVKALGAVGHRRCVRLAAVLDEYVTHHGEHSVQKRGVPGVCRFIAQRPDGAVSILSVIELSAIMDRFYSYMN